MFNFWLLHKHDWVFIEDPSYRVPYDFPINLESYHEFYYCSKNPRHRKEIHAQRYILEEKLYGLRKELLRN